MSVDLSKQFIVGESYQRVDGHFTRYLGEYIDEACGVKYHAFTAVEGKDAGSNEKIKEIFKIEGWNYDCEGNFLYWGGHNKPHTVPEREAPQKLVTPLVTTAKVKTQEKKENLWVL